MRTTAAQAAEAAETLSLKFEGLTPEAVSDAYRAAAKDCHPNSGTYDAERWSRITWAKDTLGRWLAVAEPSPAPSAPTPGRCRACGGSGRIKRPSGLMMLCVLCSGEGAV